MIRVKFVGFFFFNCNTYCISSLHHQMSVDHAELQLNSFGQRRKVPPVLLQESLKEMFLEFLFSTSPCSLSTCLTL